MSAPPSALVVRLSSLGDVLFAVPAVQHLQASGLVGRLAWLVEDRAAPLVQSLVPVDEVVVFPRRHPTRWPAHVAALRARTDELVLDFQCNLKSRLQRACLRARHVLGFAPPVAREGGERGLTRSCVPPPTARHRVAANLALLGLLGLSPPQRVPRPRLTVADAEQERARRWIDSRRGDGPLVVLHPGTSAFGSFKRWDAARFADLGARLARSHDARIVVTGSPDERDLVEAVVRPLGAHASVAPPGGLPALAALLAGARLLVAADSFPLHLANALGTPVVGLYGPKEPAVNGPFFDRAEVVRSGVACSPCTLRRCADRLCMRRIDVLQVEAAAHRQLEDPTP